MFHSRSRCLRQGELRSTMSPAKYGEVLCARKSTRTYLVIGLQQEVHKRSFQPASHLEGCWHITSAGKDGSQERASLERLPEGILAIFEPLLLRHSLLRLSPCISLDDQLLLYAALDKSYASSHFGWIASCHTSTCYPQQHSKAVGARSQVAKQDSMHCSKRETFANGSMM